MKNILFALVFAFGMFFTNATYASSTEKNSVDEHSALVLAETNESVNLDDYSAAADTIIIITKDGDVIVIEGDVVIIIL